MRKKGLLIYMSLFCHFSILLEYQVSCNYKKIRSDRQDPTIGKTIYQYLGAYDHNLTILCSHKYLRSIIIDLLYHHSNEAGHQVKHFSAIQVDSKLVFPDAEASPA
jgi:hypothetical protein